MKNFRKFSFVLIFVSILLGFSSCANGGSDGISGAGDSGSDYALGDSFSIGGEVYTVVRNDFISARSVENSRAVDPRNSKAADLLNGDFGTKILGILGIEKCQIECSDPVKAGKQWILPFFVTENKDNEKGKIVAFVGAFWSFENANKHFSGNSSWFGCTTQEQFNGKSADEILAFQPGQITFIKFPEVNATFDQFTKKLHTKGKGMTAYMQEKTYGVCKVFDELKMYNANKVTADNKKMVTLEFMRNAQDEILDGTVNEAEHTTTYYFYKTEVMSEMKEGYWVPAVSKKLMARKSDVTIMLKDPYLDEAVVKLDLSKDTITTCGTGMVKDASGLSWSAETKKLSDFKGSTAKARFGSAEDTPYATDNSQYSNYAKVDVDNEGNANIDKFINVWLSDFKNF